MCSKKVEKLKLMIEVSLHKLWKILFRNRTGISFIIHVVVQPKGVDNEFVAHMKDIWRLAIYFSTLGDKEKD